MDQREIEMEVESILEALEEEAESLEYDIPSMRWMRFKFDALKVGRYFDYALAHVDEAVECFDDGLLREGDDTFDDTVRAIRGEFEVIPDGMERTKRLLYRDVTRKGKRVLSLPSPGGRKKASGKRKRLEVKLIEKKNDDGTDGEHGSDNN